MKKRIHLTLLGGPADGFCLNSPDCAALSLPLIPGGNPTQPNWIPAKSDQVADAAEAGVTVCEATYVRTAARDREGLVIFAWPGTEEVLMSPA